jgi:alkylation response protein AidB-like acyl-CoA dehydrogenase
MSELIAFTEEQGMLLETASDFCSNHSPIGTVRSRLDADGIDTATWQEMTELGWLGINVPEAYGGLGMGLASVVPVVESMGQYLMGSPYSQTVLLAEALVSSGSEAQKQKWLPGIMSGAIGSMALTEEDGNWRLSEVSTSAEQDGEVLKLSGCKTFVQDADVAEFILVSALLNGEARLILIEKSQINHDRLRREVVIDQTRRSFQLDLEDLQVSSEQLLPAADLDRIELAAMLLLTAEMSGGLVAVLQTIVEYLNTRKAFGRTIGSYQSLKHPAADIVLSLEAVKSHLYHAATLIDADGSEVETAVRMAKAEGAEAYAYAGDRAVQFHGGFGFTFECDAQLYLRRALWCQYQFGDEKYQRRLLESLLLDEVI